MNTVFRFFIVVLSLLIANAPARAETVSEKTIIVLDASGSMWGPIENKTKMEIAKDVVKGMLIDWDPAIELGLTAYGHRRKGDCADIESLVPVGSLDKQVFQRQLDGIQPKGKTPLTDAVVQAAKELKYTENRATVILVSDGIETCDRNPCQIAKELEQAGIDFTTHVIGFDVSGDQAVEQLKCLAENTGGRFMTAKDAFSLKESLDKAVQDVATAGTGVSLTAVHEKGGKPIDGVAWQVFAKAVGELEKPKLVDYGKGAQPTYRLAPGTYLAKVRTLKGEAWTEKEFTVTEGKLAREEVVIAREGEVELVAVNETGGTPLDGVSWGVYEISEDEMRKPKQIKYGGGSTPRYRLLPGRYLAKVKSLKGEAKAEKEIEVQPGDLTREEVIIAKEGVIKLIAVNEPGGQPIENVKWTLHQASDDPLGKVKQVKYGGGSSPEYRVLPGRYVAKVESLKGQAKAEKEIEVKPGALAKEEVVIAREGIVQLVAVHEAGGEPVDGVRWGVYEITDDALRQTKQLKFGGGSKPEYRMLPGKYLAKVQALKGQAKAEKEVSVAPGKRTREEVIIAKEVIVQAGQLSREEVVVAIE